MLPYGIKKLILELHITELQYITRHLNMGCRIVDNTYYCLNSENIKLQKSSEFTFLLIFMRLLLVTTFLVI